MDAKHKNHYKMYNFCCEPGRGYDHKIFYDRVERYPFKDHNTPPLETMVAFGNSVQAWLQQDPENVVNMHCKAGKGRAGLMSCITMIRTGVAQSAVEALEIYGNTRGSNKKGLTVTSQRKSVIFYEAGLSQVWGVHGNIGDVPAEILGEGQKSKFPIPEQPAINVLGVEVIGISKDFPIEKIRVKILKGTNFKPILLSEEVSTARETTTVHCNCAVQGNFKVIVEIHQGAWKGYKKMFELIHNTFFVDSTGKWFDFHLNQLDIKKKMQKKLGKEVVLRIKFTEEDKHRSSVVVNIAEHSHKQAEQELEFESNELTTEKSNKQYKALPMVEISNQH
jgi:hypothetical protein